MAAKSSTGTAWPSLLLLSALATALAHIDGATGGSGSTAAPAPAVDCSDALISLVGCLSYVQEGTTVATPEKSCCSGLKDVVKKEVACLCQAFQGGQDYGVALNMTKALQLPAACKVKTPPFSKCHPPEPSSGVPFFGGSPSSLSAPSATSPAGTGSDSTARAPSPSASAVSTFPASANVLLAAATVAATLLV
ncbi:hypothetical protein ACQ4PT_014254 [Festuca glaucescens]